MKDERVTKSRELFWQQMRGEKTGEQVREELDRIWNRQGELRLEPHKDS